MIDNLRYKHIPHTNVFDVLDICPRWAIKTNAAYYDIQPYNIVHKTFIALLINKNRRERKDKIYQEFEETFPDRENVKFYKEMLKRNYRMLASKWTKVIAYNAYINSTICNIPIRTYIPLILQTDSQHHTKYLKSGKDKRRYEFMWPTYDNVKLSMSDLITNPSILAMITTAIREDFLLKDYEPHIFPVIMTKNTKYDITHMAQSTIMKLEREILLPFIKEIQNEERIRPGKQCTICKVYDSCKVNRERIEKLDSIKLLKISKRENHEYLKKFVNKNEKWTRRLI